MSISSFESVKIYLIFEKMDETTLKRQVIFVKITPLESIYQKAQRFIEKRSQMCIYSYSFFPKGDCTKVRVFEDQEAN